MHDEYTYLVRDVAFEFTDDDVTGEDNFGYSAAYLDLEKAHWEDHMSLPEEFTNASNGYVSKSLMDHFKARHVIVYWSSDGSRYVSAQPNYETAQRVFENIKQQYDQWLNTAEEEV